MRTVAVAGNPNCGKTTLFNRLTGQNQHVGNWAGVTVERREGAFQWEGCAIRLVDLPGIYSLSTYTLEETVSRAFLLEEAGKRDTGVLDLLDGRCLERGLYLTLQLLELGREVTVAVGMMDEVRRDGGEIDCAWLSRMLGVPVLPVAARRGEGLQKLCWALAAPPSPARPVIRYCAPLEAAVKETAGFLAPRAKLGEGLRFYLLEALAGEEESLAAFALDDVCEKRLEEVRERLRARTGEDAAQLIAGERYRQIERMVKQAVRPAQKRDVISDKIDRAALHRFWAMPLFAAIMAGVFWLCFGSVGLFLKRELEKGFILGARLLREALPALGVSQAVTGLVADGIFTGMGSVLTFLPQVALLFFSLTFLEECGYLSRAAFLWDLPLRKIGLTGMSFIPMLMGFGCTTPALMAARTLPGDRDRRLTIRLTPFLSCGAKFPIYALFAQAFFPRAQGLVVAGCYLIGIVAAAAYGWFLSKTPRYRKKSAFLMEFPPYRVPSLRNLLRNTGEKCWDFIQKAGTLIFLLSVAIWAAQHFTPALRYTPEGQGSLFILFGQAIAPLFAPLGFASREAAVALLAGTVTKEAVVSALGVACEAMGSGLSTALTGLFSPLSAAAFVTFCALYSPCVSALSSMRRELQSTGEMLRMMLVQNLIAYLSAMAVFQFGTLLMRLI